MADELTGLAKDVDEIKKSFDGITSAIHAASKQTEGWGHHLKELSSAQKASGQLWLVFGRLTSGSGLWRFQNRIKAISNFLKLHSSLPFNILIFLPGLKPIYFKFSISEEISHIVHP